MNITISINKRIIYWIVIFVLQIIFVAWYQGLLVPGIVQLAPSSTDLVMTETEARLTRQAIELVREDVVQGKLRSADLTIRALSAELPESVRERVLKALGKPEMDFMRDALEVLEGKIIERN